MQKRFRSPLYSTLKQAVGALTLHTGRNQYCKTTPAAIKKADGLVLAATLSPVSNGVRCKV